MALNNLRFEFHCMVLRGSSEAISPSMRMEGCLVQTPYGYCLAAHISQWYSKDQLWLPCSFCLLIDLPWGVAHTTVGNHKIHPR